MKRRITRSAIRSAVCVIFTSAAVFAQATKSTSQPPAGATTVTTTEVKTAAKRAMQKIAPAQAAPLAPAADNRAAEKKLFHVVMKNNRDGLVSQCRAQVRPAVRAELIFVRKVCELNTEELRHINRDAQEVVSEVVAKVVDAQLQPREIGQNQAPSQSEIDGGKLLQDGLSAVLKKDLNPQQWAKYQAERDKRDAYRKQSTLRFLIDGIDRELYLSPRQRTTLQESLSSHWQSGWSLYADNLLMGNQFYPWSIDPLVNPILNDPQKEIWQNIQKVNGYLGFVGVWGRFANDRDELEQELGEVKKATRK
jgi:hypothetical protein